LYRDRHRYYSVGMVAMEVGDKSGEKPTGKFVPNCWELFLAGENCCCCGPSICICCSCWTWFGIGWLFTLIFIGKLGTGADDIFSFEEQDVRASDVVKRHRAFGSARGAKRSCKDHEDAEVCISDVLCTWKDNTTCTKKEQDESCKQPLKPRQGPVRDMEGKTAWVMVIYEAKDGNVLDDDILERIAAFEKELLTDANGAMRKGEASPWDEDWCMKAYPVSGGGGKCSAIDSVVPLFFHD
jgi:hypothetical protein